MKKLILFLASFVVVGMVYSGNIIIQSGSFSSSGSSSPLGINKDGVSVTTPTAQINIISQTGLNVTASGSTATLSITNNLPGGSTSYILPSQKISLSTGVIGTLPIGNLTTNASSYWNYPSSGTFIDSSGIVVSTMLVTSSITISSPQTPANSSLRGQLELNASGVGNARMILGTNNLGSVYSWLQTAEGTNVVGRQMAMQPVGGCVSIGGISNCTHSLDITGDLATTSNILFPFNFYMGSTDGTDKFQNTTGVWDIYAASVKSFSVGSTSVTASNQIYANQGIKSSTLTLTGSGPGVLHALAISSNTASYLVSLSSEVIGNLPIGNLTINASSYLNWHSTGIINSPYGLISTTTVTGGTVTASSTLITPNGTSIDISAAGEIGLDTSANQLVTNDGTNTFVLAQATHTFTISISSGTGYYGFTQAGWCAPTNSAITLQNIRAASLPTGTTVQYQLNERAFGSEGSNGSNIYSVAFATANATGMETTTSALSDSSIAAGSCLYVVAPTTDTSRGNPTALRITGQWTYQRQ